VNGPVRSGSGPAIVARDVGIRFPSPHGFLSRLGRRRAQKSRWALRHVTLSVQPGEFLAVIGANGAGKSTLLQAICGLLEPDEGVLRTRGRITSLLNLGVGFDPRLTGRENVELIAALRGLRQRDVDVHLPAVIDFSEIGDAIDDPLRTYSSGMRARLGFSAAMSVEPDILVVDEVLGTGDRHFRQKSQDRLIDLMDGASTVVMATHDLNWVSESATQAILLERGSLVAAGTPAAVVEAYRSGARAD
jgi:lipopolysaccharide transport system ATP-binding protein